MTVLEQLAEFIKDSEGRMAQSKWLADDTMNVYVRRGFHSIDGLPRICLDVASVTVAVEQGTWTNFIWKAHDLNPWDCTFVECVHNHHLASWLLRNGFMPTDGMESYYMPKDPEKWKISSRSSRTSTHTLF